MPDFDDELEDLEDSFASLEGSAASAKAMTEAFRAEMDSVSTAMADARVGASSLSTAFGTVVRRAFTDLIFDGAKLSDVFGQIARNISATAFDAALRPLTSGVDSAIGGLLDNALGGFFAKGAAFNNGKVQAFANGGVVNGATAFPMRGGFGVMGEAGPEAIMPLRRGSDGRLGVETAGGSARPVQITMNISTPDAQSFSRSRTQVAAQFSRALGRGNRNL